ncbi:hypothetical protein BC941DRAFT_424698 [Chlamydoabsidia padenii]|nr:hypothetical protein BC941DRAFT_424698 [Chlamydoabsidia padenii]
MTMSLTGIKARKTFGPKVVNIYDDISDDDDDNDDVDGDDNDDGDDDMDDGVDIDAAAFSKRTMDTLRDIFYMDDGQDISLHAVYRPEQLDMPVATPKDGGPLVVSISVHFHTSSTWNSQLLPKGLTIFSNTGDAYSIALDRICALTSPSLLEHSTVGYFLTSPDVKRISWRYGFFCSSLDDKLGFKVGPVIEISDCLRPDQRKWKLKDVIDHYIGDWKGMQQYQEAKQDVDTKEQAALRKFSGSMWDKETLTDATLIFSAAQGAMMHELYKALVWM